MARVALDADVIIFSDDAKARDDVAKVVDEMPGLNAVVAGSVVVLALDFLVTKLLIATIY